MSGRCLPRAVCGRWWLQKVIRRPMPTTEMRVPTRFRRSAQAKDVNCALRRRMAARTDGATMLHGHDLGRIEATDRLMQRLDARQLAYPRHGVEPVADQGPMFGMREARTFLVNQSMMATRQRQALRIG